MLRDDRGQADLTRVDRSIRQSEAESTSVSDDPVTITGEDLDFGRRSTRDYREVNERRRGYQRSEPWRQKPSRRGRSRGRGASNPHVDADEYYESAGFGRSSVEQPSMRQVRMEAESEVAAEAGGYGRMEAMWDEEMADTEMTMMEELDQRIEAQQRELEVAAESEALDGAMDREFEAMGETELGLEAQADAELGLEQELGQDLEQEYEAMEQVFEYQFEQEFEMEMRTENEAESGWDDDPVTNQEEEVLLDVAMGSEEWGTGFASADELLGDLSGDFDPFDEEMI